MQHTSPTANTTPMIYNGQKETVIITEAFFVFWKLYTHAAFALAILSVNQCYFLYKYKPPVKCKVCFHNDELIITYYITPLNK